MKIQGATLLVTGANRGLGRSLVLAALAADARRVCATARDPKQLEPLTKQSGERVVPFALDVTDERSIEAAAARATDVNVLVNNAGTLASYGVLDASPADLTLDFATNLFGLLATTKALVERAFLPRLDVDELRQLQHRPIHTPPPVGALS